MMHRISMNRLHVEEMAPIATAHVQAGDHIVLPFCTIDLQVSDMATPIN